MTVRLAASVLVSLLLVATASGCADAPPPAVPKVIPVEKSAAAAPAPTPTDVAAAQHDARDEAVGVADPSELGRPLTLRQGPVKVTGRLPPPVILRIVRQNYGRFQRCYAEENTSTALLPATVTIELTIGQDGQPIRSVDHGSDLKAPSVVACFAEAFRGMSFPQPSAGTVEVIFPLVLTAAPSSGP